MNTRKSRYNKKIGSIPGTLHYTGKKDDQQLHIEVFNYTKDICEETEAVKFESLKYDSEYQGTTWLNLNGLSHVNEISKIGEYFTLHPLILEDIVNVFHRPKLEEYEDYIFVVLKMLYYGKAGNLVGEQVSFVLGKNYVLSFQEFDGDVFEPIRERLRQGQGRIRGMAADYLLYCLIDAVVDHYFILIDNLSNKIERLETQLFEGHADLLLNKKIQELKREILRIRRAIYPLREVIIKVDKLESPLINKKTKAFYRDVYDHIIHVTENIEIYREMVSGLMDMYLNNISNRMNQVMKTLTIMASIFIPLTFLAGIYGMNFEHIPELSYKWAYFILLAVMVLIAIIMIIYFKRKKWM